MIKIDIFDFNELSYENQCYYFAYILLKYFSGKKIDEISNELPFISKQSIIDIIYGTKVFNSKTFKELKKAFERNPEIIKELEKITPNEFCKKLKQFYKKKEKWYKKIYNKFKNFLKKIKNNRKKK